MAADRPVAILHAPADVGGNAYGLSRAERELGLVSDVAVFRPSDGYWYVRGIASVQWGQAGDIPVPADYDGDRRADFAVYRNGGWFVRGAASNWSFTQWGLAGDVPVPADLPAVIARVQTLIVGEGGTFAGDAAAGQFAGPTPVGTVEGLYVVQGSVIRVTITSKPLVAPCSAIEAKVRKYFG